MIKRIIDFSLDNRMVVIVMWLLIVALGIKAMLELPIDAVPDVTNVQVQVLTNSPGLAPEEVEKFITFPVETSMSGIPNVEQIRSVSKFGLSAVTIVFEEGTDIYWARQLIGERLVDAREQIPEGYGEPEMGPISTGLGEIYQFEVRGEGYTPMELRTILDWNINYQLRSVQGVVEINAFGGELKTYQITLDDAKLAAYGLGVGDVMESVRGNNRNVGGGYIERGGEQYLIRGEGLIESLTDLGEIVVAHGEQGTPVYVRDLGVVEFAPMIRQGAVTRDGEREAVVGIVMMLMGENSRVVARDVDAKIDEIRASLPEGVTIDTFYDRTELVDRTIKTVATNLLEGGILVVIVLLLLVGNLRAGLLVAASIPLSMMIAFVVMRYAGISGNLMSLGALDFGIIVDGTVVVIENIMRYLSEHKDQKGVSHREKIRRACHEVARPVVFAVSIIMIVYLPVLALRGIEGKMFRPMALTVVFAMAGSLFCAITLMPVLATFFLKKVREKEPLMLRWAKRIYEPALAFTMRRPLRTALVAGAIFLGSLGIVPFLGAEFMPRLDEGAIAMQIWRLPSISLEKSNEISMRAERVVMEFPEVKTVVSRTGRPEIATDPMGVEISDTYIILHPPDTWRFDSKAELLAAINEQLEQRVPGAIFSYSQPIELRVAELISGVRSDIGIKIFGDDIELMKAKADEMVAVLRDVRGIAEAKAEQTTGLPLMRVKLRRDEIARLGINAEDVLEVIEAVGGKQVSTVFEGQQRFALQVRFGAEVRGDLERIGDLRIKAPGVSGGAARLVPLSQLADITISTGAAQISREKISRRTTVEANVRGRDLASTVAEARQKIEEQVELPPGWYVEWGGQFENLEQAAGRLVFLVPLALLLIFMLLYGVFQSAALGTLIFLNVPLAVTGGVVFLALRGYPLSISAGVGFIALFGIAVMNGVVLVSSAQQLRAEGLNAKDASHRAAKLRLRPVLMTALTDMIGFVPMAMATSAGAEVQRPLATVVIGGLVTASLLTLLVLPAIYRWFAPKRTGVEL